MVFAFSTVGCHWGSRPSQTTSLAERLDLGLLGEHVLDEASPRRVIQLVPNLVRSQRSTTTKQVNNVR